MSDPVNHPAHYGGDVPYEVIKVINAWELSFDLSTAIKYIARAGKKNPKKTIEDLQKAIFYINDEIKQLQGQGTRAVEEAKPAEKPAQLIHFTFDVWPHCGEREDSSYKPTTEDRAQVTCPACVTALAAVVWHYALNHDVPACDTVQHHKSQKPGDRRHQLTDNRTIVSCDACRGSTLFRGVAVQG